DNITSGKLKEDLFGNATIPVEKIKTTNAWASDATKFLSANGTWATPAGGGATGVIGVPNGGTGIDNYAPGDYLRAKDSKTLERYSKAQVQADLDIDKKEDLANKSTSATFVTDANGSASETKYPSVKAVKTY